MAVHGGEPKSHHAGHFAAPLLLLWIMAEKPAIAADILPLRQTQKLQCISTTAVMAPQFDNTKHNTDCAIYLSNMGLNPPLQTQHKPNTVKVLEAAMKADQMLQFNRLGADIKA